MDEEDQPKGRPIPILIRRERNKKLSTNEEASETHRETHIFSLDEEALEKVLLQDHIRDRIAIVVSVAGAFRKGKSFLLDFFLRYLYFEVRKTIRRNFYHFGKKIQVYIFRCSTRLPRNQMLQFG